MLQTNILHKLYYKSVFYEITEKPCKNVEKITLVGVNARPLSVGHQCPTGCTVMEADATALLAW